ncbi:MAG: DUF2867 domain-containing protein [Tannerellaceae bacterium]|jgi:hypothetical protein|nr:DUF2867 domain-containing protein [Tannerellaceae bacterium]
MGKVSKTNSIPKESNVLDGFNHVDYLDVYEIEKKTNKSAKEISKEIMRLPNWVNFLFKLRNSLVKVFGLKVDKQNEGEETFFTLIKESDNEIIMGEDDKHLNFRASIMIDKSRNTIALITLVHFNNLLGKVYFLPVKPFHKIIMRSLLKRHLKSD